MPEEVKAVAPMFQIRAVELHELSIKKPPVPGFSVTNFNFEIKIDANVDANQKIILLATNIKVHGDDKITELGSITCACAFSVSNFDEVVKIKSDNTFELDPPFAETLNSIAISTTRGMMFSELKGTILHNALLPLIDIKTLTKAEFIARS